MTLTNEQSRKISLLSDSILYREAVSFIRRFVGQQRTQLPQAIVSLQQFIGDEPNNLPQTSQVMGLQNIANAATYGELNKFVIHQRDRTWTGARRDTKAFYVALEKYFAEMKRRRLKDEFHLIGDGLSNRELNQLSDELMIMLAREFIQHLTAEHGLFLSGS